MLLLRNTLPRNRSVLAKCAVPKAHVKTTTYPSSAQLSSSTRTYVNVYSAGAPAHAVHLPAGLGSSSYATLSAAAGRHAALDKKLTALRNRDQKPTVVISSDSDEVETVGDHIRV